MGTIQEGNRCMSSLRDETKIEFSMQCFMCGYSNKTDDFEWKVMNRYFYICPNCNGIVVTKENSIQDIFKTICFLSFFSILSNSFH